MQLDSIIISKRVVVVAEPENTIGIERYLLYFSEAVHLYYVDLVIGLVELVLTKIN